MSFWQYMVFDFFSGIQSFLLTFAAVKCLTISFYLCLLYFIICAVKKLPRVTMGVRAGYYIWYALLLAFPLSGLEYNTAVTLPVFEAHLSEINTYWYIISGASMLWFLIVLYKLENYAVTNIKLEGAIGLMKDCGDVGGIKNKAAEAFGLRGKRIRVVAADCVNAPVSYGVFRRAILLPRDYESHYSDDELYLLLLHEMAHFKNGDIVKFTFLSLLKCVIFAPPGLLRDFKRDSEILCDSRVTGIGGVEKRQYGELLVRECSGQRAPIKGLAFSDSFRTIESRLNALLRHKQEKHGFAIFTGFIFATLIASCAWFYAVPDQWYMDSHPDGPLPHHIFVMFEDEDYMEALQEQNEALAGGAIPDSFPGRPSKDFFEGTYEFLDSDTIQIDRHALYERLSTLERHGAGVRSVIFTVRNYDMTTNHPKEAAVEIPLSALEPQEGVPQFEANDFEVTMLEDFYLFMAHWL